MFFWNAAAPCQLTRSSASTRADFYSDRRSPTRSASASFPFARKGNCLSRRASAAYSLEYGDAEMEMHVDSIEPGEKIVLIDDLLATGGTSAAAAALIQKAGGELLEAQFLIELEFLHGREKLNPTPVTTFLKF